MTLHDAALEFSNCVWADFNESPQSTTKEEIEQADGRRDRNNPISQKGSYLYAAYDSDGQLLYVGETEKSLKRRFISDGEGAHKFDKEHQKWYENMETVKYKKLNPSDGEDDEEDDKRYRKLLERALILAGNPEHNDPT